MKKNRQKDNRHLNEKPVYTGIFNVSTKIYWISYAPDFFSEKQINHVEDIPDVLDERYIHWFNVTGMNDSNMIIELVKRFGLNELDAKDILTAQHIMMVEEYGDNLFIVMPVGYSVNDLAVSEQLALIKGRNYLIMIRENDHPLFDNVYSFIKNTNNQRFMSRKTEFLMASIINNVIVNYSDEIIRLEDRLEDYEDMLLDTKNLSSGLITDIQEERREMIRLRRLLFPFKEQLAKLLHANPALIDPQEIPFFKDIYDQLLFVIHHLESCREIISSLVDLYLNNNDVKMNHVMKQLTLVSTIFIPLTFLVGVWGMNFSVMPELGWKYGYLAAWCIMIGLAFLVWYYLKKKDWM